MVAPILIICALACLFLGGLILVQDARKTSNLLFAGMCACFAVWAFSILVFIQTDSVATAFTAAKIFYLVAALFPCLLLLFALIFPRKEKILFATKLAISLAGLTMALLIVVDSHFVIEQVVIADMNYATVDKPTYILYSVYFVLFFFIAMFVALRKFYKYRGDMRMQAGYYAFGILINSVPGFVTNLFLPYFGVYEYIWVGPAASLFFLGLTTYSIIRHSLFDIRLAAVRSVAYVFALVTLSVVYYLLAYIVSITLFRGEITSTVSANPVNILIALFLAFLFQPIKRMFDKITNDIFFRDRYNSDEFFARLSGLLTTTSDLRMLLQRAASDISSTLKAEQAFFVVYVYNGHKHHLSAGTQHHGKLPNRDADQLDEYVKAEGDAIIITRLMADEHVIRRMLLSHDIAILMPLMREGVIMGYLALGEQRSSGYTDRDIKALGTISDELVIAIQNALYVQEVKEINTHLQQRVNAATEELRTKNAQLRHLDSTKDEFLSLASHQLRTPLTSVKGYISMILEGDVGKVNDMQKHLLNEAFTSSERMVHLIHDFLNVSRLQTGKFMLEQHPYDLVKLVKEEVNSLRRTAEVRNMKLKFVTNVDELPLNIDENKIRQVIMNFIDNALYYSHEGTTITIDLTVTDNTVEMKVVDTGIGVPKAEQEQLFSKFYRASNARKQRPDGTGVGIYLAKKVVAGHGGDVIFESVEGKGSTFGFSLPIDHLKVELENDAK